jgi:hypothetical protein
MIALLQRTPFLARLVARNQGNSVKPEPEWRRRYRALYGQDPPPWRLGNEPETVVAWIREYVAREGCKPLLSEVQEVFHLPKTTAWRRLRSA